MRCPVCDVPVPIYGPDGVFPVHILTEHPDSIVAAWIKEQLKVAAS